MSVLPHSKAILPVRCTTRAHHNKDRKLECEAAAELQRGSKIHATTIIAFINQQYLKLCAAHNMWWFHGVAKHGNDHNPVLS